jgi:WD40 repeat protein
MKDSLLRSPFESELQTLDDTFGNSLSQQQSLYHGEVCGHSGPVNWAAFSPDSCRLLTCSDDKTSRLLNLCTKSVIILRGHDAAVTFGEFSRGSAVALTCSRDGSVRLWHAEIGSVLHILRPSSPAHMACFSRSGNQLVSARSPPFNRLFPILFRLAAATTTQPESFLAAVATK